MTCHELRRFLDLYLDSELGSEETLAVTEHLEGCEPCRTRVQAEVHLEARLRDHLLASAPGDDAVWTRALRRAVGRRSRGGWTRRLAAALLLAAVGLAMWAYVSGVGRENDLAAAVVAHHRGRPGPDAGTGTWDGVARLVAARTGIGDLGPGPAGAALRGARACTLGGAPVVQILLDAGGRTVSLFALPRGAIDGFPEARAELAGHGGRWACAVRPERFVVVERPGGTVLVAVGEVPHEALGALVGW